MPNLLRDIFTHLASKVLLAMVLLAILALSIAAQNKPGTMVRTDDYVGVIFPAERKAFHLDLYEKGLEYWTPSEADIQIAERELPGFLRSAATKNPRGAEILKKLKTYKRQYAGIILRGEKQIYINFFCVVDLPGDRWTRDEVIVLDGGSCFFTVRFSLKTKAFLQLMINGVA